MSCEKSGGGHEQLNPLHRIRLEHLSMPAGSQAVGEVPAHEVVYLMDGSLLRDWVFIGKPGPDVPLAH
jgi:hypothetical protein